jgi:hypothetical protein
MSPPEPRPLSDQSLTPEDQARETDEEVLSDEEKHRLGEEVSRNEDA